jgi:hypothetical protein
MTHDELLDRIAQAGLEPHGNVMPTHLVFALRAVVELHKPDEFNHCGVCNQYLCQTIQAIEKDLA